MKILYVLFCAICIGTVLAAYALTTAWLLWSYIVLPDFTHTSLVTFAGALCCAWVAPIVAWGC